MPKNVSRETKRKETKKCVTGKKQTDPEIKSIFEKIQAKISSIVGVDFSEVESGCDLLYATYGILVKRAK